MILRLSIDRARLHSGRPSIRVQRGKRVRHMAAVAGHAFVLRTEKVHGRWFVYLYTDEVQAL